MNLRSGPFPEEGAEVHTQKTTKNKLLLVSFFALIVSSSGFFFIQYAPGHSLIVRPRP